MSTASLKLETAIRRCKRCALRPVCLPAALEHEELVSLESRVRTSPLLSPGDFLYHAGEAANNLYVVRVGSFKSVRVRKSGEEHIVGFHLPGDVFGLEAMEGAVHSLDAIALEKSSVCIVPHSDIRGMITDLPGFGGQLCSMVGKQCSELYVHQMLMQCFAAQERLALFLLRHSERLETHGRTGASFSLSMARRELANYLGLQVETVSRIFSAMKNDGILDVDGRLVVIRDFHKLRSAAGIEPEESAGLVAG